LRPHEDGRDDSAQGATLIAIRSALQLGGSLLFTWSIALVIRFIVPRYLGPARFGALSFADAFTTTCFVVLNLGVDTYIRKEVAIRPAHASDFFGGAAALRGVMTLAVFGVMCAILSATHRPREVWALVALYGVAQLFVTTNATLSALLHASGRVRVMSVLAVVTKVIWAGGVLAALATHAGLWAYAVAYIASESVETVVLYRLAEEHLDLSFRIDRAATRGMLVSSLPYYLTIFTTMVYGKLDVSLLSMFGNDREVGWYSAASSVANLTLLLTPLIGWVLMPMFSRAMDHSREELYAQVRRAMELILSLAIPVSLMIVLGAPTLMGLLFGRAYLASALALQILAVMSVLTYVAIVLAQTLTMLDRAWALTTISILGLFVNVGLNLTLLPRFVSRGPGAGGTACAVAMLSTEVFVTSCMFAIVGRHAFDLRSAKVIAKTLAAAAAVAVAHRAMSPLGPFRLALDVALYAVLVLSTGTLDLRTIFQTARTSMRRPETADSGGGAPEKTPASAAGEKLAMG
jgi:O-antigen/teichoic acid export membrane protein